MIALTRMRIGGFVRSGRALAPLVAFLAVLGVLHGGGPAPARSAYGYSAVALFALLAWLTKLILDTEPDVQRGLARLAVGPVREGASGLLAAGVLGAGICLLSLLVPVGLRAVHGPWVSGVLLGVFAHVLALLAALALGALSARPVTRRVLPGVAVLVTGSVLTIVLGLSSSIAPWPVPPMMATARALSGTALPDAATLAQLGAWTALWCTAALLLYARLRRDRA